MAEKKKKEKDEMNKKVIAVCSLIMIIVVIGVAIGISFKMDKKTVDGGFSEADALSIAEKTEKYTESTTEKPTETTTEKQTETTTVTTAIQKTTTVKTSKTGNGIKLLTEPTLIDLPSDDSEWSLILLNTYYRVSSDVDDYFTLIPAISGSGVLLDSRAAAAYQKMYDAGRKDGVTLTPCSGYRSYSLQKDLYNELVDEYLNDGYSQAESEALASTRRMPAGSSEHNIGIAMDICYVDSSFKYSAEYRWLCEHAEDYGFILRYTEENKQYTGVKSEPWHWRYVGVENAKKINASGLSLEQYVGKVN